MNQEFQLKIQAWVDGEIPAPEASQVEHQIQQDPAAQELVLTLESLRRLVRDNEPEHPLPESRDFYFSQIQRRIEAEERCGDSREAGQATPLWLRWFAPAGFLAACLALLLVNQRPGLQARAEEPTVQMSLAVPGGFTFYAAEGDMTVVWVENAPSSGFTALNSQATLPFE